MANPPASERNWDFKAGEVLLFNKPLKWSSFYLVKKVRRLIGKEKVGHAGTLDPLATGLMILCTGKKTKTIDSYMGLDKEYVMTLCIGATTPSLDSEFPPENLRDASGLTREAFAAILPLFQGEQQQLPPQYSAIKVDGRRAYDAARKGQTMELKPRTITIHKLELLDFTPASPGGQASATLVVACSKGTYVRSLAADMGTHLGLGAFLTALKRTRIGNHDLANAWEFDQFSALFDASPSEST